MLQLSMKAFYIILFVFFPFYSIYAQDRTANKPAKTPQIFLVGEVPQNIDTSKIEVVVIDNFPEPLSEIQPLVVYPEVAMRSGLEGKVIISILVGKKGEVLKTEIDSSTNEIFTQSAVEAAKKIRFKPAHQNGKPVKIWYVLPVNYKLTEIQKNPENNDQD
jgi:TonB family protein